jgi:hypothetical protein
VPGGPQLGGGRDADPPGGSGDQKCRHCALPLAVSAGACLPWQNLRPTRHRECDKLIEMADTWSDPAAVTWRKGMR